MSEPARPAAYILAHIRRGPYYVDVASSVDAIMSRRQAINQERIRSGENNMTDPVMAVWFECFDTIEQARARAEQVRALPRPWQRRLIENMNPEWWDQADLHLGLPLDLCYQVPETTPKTIPRR